MSRSSSRSRCQVDPAKAAAELSDELLAALTGGATSAFLPPIGGKAASSSISNNSIRKRFQCGYTAAHTAWGLARARLSIAGLRSEIIGSGKRAAPVFSMAGVAIDAALPLPSLAIEDGAVGEEERSRSKSQKLKFPDYGQRVLQSSSRVFNVLQCQAHKSEQERRQVVVAALAALERNRKMVGPAEDGAVEQDRRRGKFDVSKAAAELAREVKGALVGGREDVALPPISVKSEALQPPVQSRFGCSKVAAAKVHQLARARLSMAGYFSHRTAGSGTSSVYTSAVPPAPVNAKPQVSGKRKFPSMAPLQCKGQVRQPIESDNAAQGVLAPMPEVGGKRRCPSIDPGQRKSWRRQPIEAENSAQGVLAPTPRWRLNLSAQVAIDLDAPVVALTASSAKCLQDVKRTKIEESWAPLKSFIWETASPPAHWPAHLVGLLGRARASKPFACASRCTAKWLLFSSIEAVAAYRPTAVSLVQAKAWGPQQEQSLRKIQVLAVVMKALGSIELPSISTPSFRKAEQSAAATAAMLASVRVQRAHCLLSSVVARADSLSSLLTQSIKARRPSEAERRTAGTAGGVRGHNFLKRYPSQQQNHAIGS